MPQRFSLAIIWKLVVKAMSRLFRGGRNDDGDFAGVRVPIRRGPPDRRSAVVLDEP